jgi:hypothetical protein
MNADGDNDEVIDVPVVRSSAVTVFLREQAPQTYHLPLNATIQ